MIEWTDANEVFLPEIDEEHKELFRMVRGFEEAVAEGATAKIRLMLKDVATHADHHFRHEERLMRAANCPSYAWHKRQHDGIRATMAMHARNIGRGDSDSPRVLVEYLATWLRDHTGVTDRIMGASLRANRRFCMTARS